MSRPDMPLSRMQAGWMPRGPPGHQDQLSATTKTMMPASIDSTAWSIGTSTSTTSLGSMAVSDANLQRKLASMEGYLKEVDGLLKNQLNGQQPSTESLDERCARIREEVLLMQQSREKIEARAQSLEDLLQQEKQEHEAQMANFEKDLSASLKNLSKGLEDSVSTSMHLMKVKVVETEKVLKTLIKQLNCSSTPALTESEVHGSGKAQGPSPDVLKGAMQRLLEEHDQLIQQQNDLLTRRQPLAHTALMAPAPTAVAGTPIRWTAPVNSTAMAGMSQQAASPSPGSPHGEAPANRVPAPMSPRLATRGSLGSPAEGAANSWAARINCPTGSASPTSPKRSLETVTSSPNLAMVFAAPGGSCSPAASHPSPASRTSPARASMQGSPKSSPKASPQGSPKASPKPLRIEGSPSRTNLMACFVDMQTGQELEGRNQYSV